MCVLQDFWKSNPALLYGICILLGVFTSLYPQTQLTLIALSTLFLLTILLPFKIVHVPLFLMNLCLYIVTIFYSSCAVSQPALSANGIQGKAFFNIHNLSYKQAITGKNWLYQGKIALFKPSREEHSLINIPATLPLHDQELLNRPPADRPYLIEGRLKQTSEGKYIFYPQKEKPWTPILSGFSMAEWRYQAKQQVMKYIENKIHLEPSRSFLTGIVTGEFDNRLLSFHFSRFGLQHIMAISGFHFSILASMIGSLACILVGRKKGFILLMCLLTAYFVFLGLSPSIIRAWVSCMVAAGALVFERKASSLNSLGLGLIVVLIIEPSMALHLGFQFSFLVTASILLFYKPIDKGLEVMIPKKTMQQVMEMDRLNQLGFILLHLFRQALALCIAVNLAALPLTLFYFKKFAVMSILYNFFFPWMVSLSMMLLLGGVISDVLFPSLSPLVHTLNTYFTQFVLDYAYRFPRHLDLSLQADLTHAEVMICITLYFLVGIYSHSFLKKRNDRFDLEPLRMI